MGLVGRSLLISVWGDEDGGRINLLFGYMCMDSAGVWWHGNGLFKA